MRALGFLKGDYYSQPWEYIAEVYGDVRRGSYESGAAERAFIYWEATIYFSRTVKELEGY